MIVNIVFCYICSYHPIPIVFSQAKGSFVWDPEGNKYLDFLSAYSAVNQVTGEKRDKEKDMVKSWCLTNVRLTSIT